MGGCLEAVISIFKVRKTYNISGKKMRELYQIAEGGYGYVLLVEDVDSKKKYALKKLICQTDEQKDNFHQEVDMMKRLSSCKHIIGYHGFHEIVRDGYL
jgi:serine/threonine protein kinase